MLRNFSFVIKDRLAGCAAPGTWDPIEDDLQALKEVGITALVSLTEESLDAVTVEEAGLDYLHEPVPDFHPPRPAQIRRFVEFVKSRIEGKARGAVAVHCFAGRGRTGTLLACYLVATGLDAEEAVRTVRRLRPGSIETREQERAVRSYQAWLQEMGQWKRLGKRRKSKHALPKSGKGSTREESPGLAARSRPKKKEGKRESEPSSRTGSAGRKGRSARGRNAKGESKREGKKSRPRGETKGTAEAPDLFDDMT